MSAQATPESVREELLAWLPNSWDPNLSLLEWRRRLLEAGLAAWT